jgi:CHAD domain-containing protein
VIDLPRDIEALVDRLERLSDDLRTADIGFRWASASEKMPLHSAIRHCDRALRTVRDMQMLLPIPKPAGADREMRREQSLIKTCSNPAP